MSARADLLQRERQRIVDFLRARGITEVRVFGSIARGEADDKSDIDLLVELPGERSPGGELLEALELSELLSSMVGVRVDVVTARSLRPEVRPLALREALPL